MPKPKKRLATAEIIISRPGEFGGGHLGYSLQGSHGSGGQGVGGHISGGHGGAVTERGRILWPSLPHQTWCHPHTTLGATASPHVILPPHYT